MPTSSPVIVSPDQGEVYSIGPLRIVSLIQGGQTAGAFELYELTLGPSTIDYHVHRGMDETLCVVSGEVEFVVEGKRISRPGGSVAYIPRGLHHGFTNHRPYHARLLILFSPSGSQHEYFRALEKLFSSTPLDLPAVQALQKRYDQEVLPMDR